jgi:virginiamycin A acetyltransferase
MPSLGWWCASLAIVLVHAVYRARLFSFPTISRTLALVPGWLGGVWRAEWYRRALDSCGERIRVEWMAVIKTPRTRVGRDVYIGAFCSIGWADIGDDVLLGGHITILSGARHHRIDDLDLPIGHQGGALTKVTIGSDVWIGNGAIVMADVAAGSVVAAGAVVTQTFAPRSILAGVPARLVRERGANALATEPD